MKKYSKQNFFLAKYNKEVLIRLNKISTRARRFYKEKFQNYLRMRSASKVVLILQAKPKEGLILPFLTF